MDQLVLADASHALILADARHEQALAIYDASGKRKGRQPGSVPKKGKRWGLIEDKPFKPLPYVELPVGLSEQEVDQFLREQRLEDLQRKLQLQQLEDVDPDIRPPSPPPLYDRQGNRLNTRETRIRKAMLAEYNRLIRYMIKAIDGYVPPAEWKPLRLVKKVIIPYEKWPNAPFMGVIIGARGVNHKHLQEVTGCRIFIRGQDIADKWQTDEELQMPQHVHIEGDTEEQILSAEKHIMPLLNPESPEFEYARVHGMQQVALVNGFSLKRTEQRCGVCGAIGHLGFECPETESYGYKMANIVCAICGDKGHVASDCKVSLEKHQRENVDWKEAAEKKAEMDDEYAKLLSELGLPGDVPKVTETSQLGRGIRPPMRPMFQQASAGLLAGAAAAAALLAENANKAAPSFVRASDQVETSGATATETQTSDEAGSVDAPPVVPSMVSGGSSSSTSKAPPRPPPPPPPPPVPQPKAPVGNYTHAHHSQSSVQRPPWASQARPMRPAFHNVSFADADGSISCPRPLAERLHSEGFAVLHEISQETGTAVSLADRSDAAGGPHFLIAGPLESRDRTKLHVRAWLDVNSRLLGLGPPASEVSLDPPWKPSLESARPQGINGFDSSPPQWKQSAVPQPVGPPSGFPPGFPPSGFPPGFLPDGFPPGFPPAGFPPAGFPPAGFPPPGFPPGPPMSVPMMGSAPPTPPPWSLPNRPAAPMMAVGPPMGMSLEIYNDI